MWTDQRSLCGHDADTNEAVTLWWSFATGMARPLHPDPRSIGFANCPRPPTSSGSGAGVAHARARRELIACAAIPRGLCRCGQSALRWAQSGTHNCIMELAFTKGNDESDQPGGFCGGRTVLSAANSFTPNLRGAAITSEDLVNVE